MKRSVCLLTCAAAALLASPALADPSAQEPVRVVVDSAAPPPADAPRPRPAPKTTVRGIATGGISTAGLFGISSTAMHAGIGIGAEHGRLYAPMTLDVALGQTRSELSAGEVKLGAGIQGVVGPVRLGVGLDVGYAWIGRAPSSSGSHIGMYAIDAHAVATVDVVDIGDGRAIYVGVKPSLGLRWGESLFAFDHGAIAWRGAAMVGARF